jgi:hypothetical protein
MPRFSSWIASAQATLRSRTRPKRESGPGLAQHHLERSGDFFSKHQNEYGTKAGAPTGLALHELGLILVIIGSLIYIASVLCMPPSLGGKIGHSLQATVWFAAPTSQSPVK